MLTPRSRKKGIEISHWKVGNSDEFQSMEQDEDYDIEQEPPEDANDDTMK